MPVFYKKTIRYVLTLITIISLNFVIPRLMPGDPVVNLLGEELSFHKEQVETLRKEMGLTKPLGHQYLDYWKDILRFKFGYSYHFHQEVSGLLLGRMKWTLLLVGLSVVFGAFIGAFFGSRAGWRSEKVRSRLSTALFLFFYSIPPFFLAILFLYAFSFKLGLFPLKGYYGTGTLLDTLWHLVLPVIVLTLFTSARNHIIMRGSVLQEKNRLYPLFARAKGLSDKQVLNRHVFWNASLPLITLIALDFGFIFSGALFIEIVFSMNGMGTLIYDSIKTLDYPVLQGAFLVIALMVISANIIADITYSLVDPRVRHQR